MAKLTPPPVRKKGGGETDNGSTDNNDNETEKKDHDDEHRDGRASRARQGCVEKIREWEKAFTKIQDLVKEDYADGTKEERAVHKKAVVTSLSATRELLKQIKKKVQSFNFWRPVFILHGN